MNLSFILEFLLFLNIAAVYVTCHNWTQWGKYGRYQSRRITGGNPINSQEEFPYLVSFRYPSGQHRCGGSILNERYVLTAAHCVDESPSSIQYGSLKVDPNGPNVVSVKRIIVHENFESDYFINDIAILELEEDIKFGKHASPVRLPYQNEVIPQTNDMYVMGWGAIHHEETASSPKHALYAKISSFSDGYCLMEEEDFNSTYQFCGGVLEGGRGHCSGDSGGPVMINGKQYGIVSWSHKPCATVGNPGVYTRLPTYRIWIYKHVGV